MRKKKSILLLWVVFGLSSCLKDVPPREPKDVDEEVDVKVVDCSETAYDEWETSPYVLPYPAGKSYSVSLSHCGGSYHSLGQPDQFAIDFVMNIGTAITAARSGKVVHVEESGFDGGFPNNLVVVQHSDGTYAQYMHLTHDGARVEDGQNVQKGEVIGFSGSTGLAGFPHLHFVATKAGSHFYPYESFPTTFSNTTANPRSLEGGKTYKAEQY